MEINNTSSIRELLQAVNGTWDLTTQNDWKCLENGKMRLFKKIVSGASPLPDKFINNRREVTPYLLFNKDTVSGGVIRLQDTAITADGLVLIIEF